MEQVSGCGSKLVRIKRNVGFEDGYRSQPWFSSVRGTRTLVPTESSVLSES
jgi:hypothetical protein